MLVILLFPFFKITDWFTSRESKKARNQLVAGAGLQVLDYEYFYGDRIFGWTESDSVIIYLQHGYPVEKISADQIGKIEQIMCYGSEGSLPQARSNDNMDLPFSERTDVFEFYEAELRLYDAQSGDECARLFFDDLIPLNKCIQLLEQKCPQIDRTIYEVNGD